VESESYDLDQREEDLTLLLHAWPDIEEELLSKNDEESVRSPAGAADALRHAYRVEVQQMEGPLATPMLGYVALFDVNNYAARRAAASLGDSWTGVNEVIKRHTPTQGLRPSLKSLVVPLGRPVEGEVCPRVLASIPMTADLRDLPEPEPPATDVPFVDRGHHKLTPIEAPFFDTMTETKLTFAVQPRVQGPDRMYRPDLHRVLRRAGCSRGDRRPRRAQDQGAADARRRAPALVRVQAAPSLSMDWQPGHRRRA
jgi:hypothetical protein